MKKKILSFSLVIVTLISIFNLMCITRVEAATTYGYGFSSRPIKIYAGSELTSNQINILNQAISKWNSTSLGTFFTYGGVKSLYNPIKADGWNTITTANLDSGIGGQTRTVINGSNIVEANILINSNNFTLSTVMHELGHALGLDDNTDTNSVMCWINYNSTTITSNDLSDLRSLY